MTDSDDWTPLHGGNVNTVSRRGGVVRRRKNVASPAVHQLLGHLEARALPLVPRLQGHDAQHEYLTYLPGAPVLRPWPDAVRGRGEAWLTDLGGWLRAYHGAVRGFRAEDATFLWGPAEPGAGMIVTHGDLGPWNLLHQRGRLTGVIDWDLARYGNPLDDVAELALEAVPLHRRHEETLIEAKRGLLEARLKLFCRAYDAPVRRVLEHVPVYLQMVIDDTRDLAARGVDPFAAFERGGMSAGLEDDLRYCLHAWL